MLLYLGNAGERFAEQKVTNIADNRSCDLWYGHIMAQTVV